MPLVEPRSASSYMLSIRRMPACLRLTAGSASTTVLPATEPSVVTSSVRLIAWFASGPRMNSSRATGAQPQNRHFVQTGSMTRRQPPQTFCFLATRASDDRLELEVRLAERDRVVADEVVLADDLALVDVA